MSDEIAFHRGMAPIADRYDGFILDLWGVIHDGVTLYPGVVETLDRLSSAGKKQLMLSNAPRRSAAVIESMVGMGMPEGHCQQVVSSGEIAWQEMRDWADPWYRDLAPRYYHIGPDRDLNLFDGLRLEPTQELAEAGLIVNTGPWEDDETVEDYEPVMTDAVMHALPMLCVNPDIEVIRGGRRIICAGALAQRYEALGGIVRYVGKPHAEVYDYCLSAMGLEDRTRVLVVGDSLRTDIAGATAAGIDSLFVLKGIDGHRVGGTSQDPPSPAAIGKVCAEVGLRPIGAIPAFVW